MRQIHVTAKISNRWEFTLNVEDDATDEEIKELAQSEANEASDNEIFMPEVFCYDPQDVRYL
jgi:hypothetical protein